MTRVQLRTPSALRIVFDGQSHNRWPDHTIGDQVGPYPDRFMAHLPGVPWANVSIVGTGWGTLSGTAPTRLWPHARRGAGLDLLIMQGGQHDLIEGATPEQTYDRAAAYADAARAAGFGMVVGSTMPAINPLLIAPERIAGHNAAIVADASGAFDAVARWDLPVELSDPLDPRYFWSDTIHFAPGGAAVAAEVTWAVVAPLIAHLT